MKIMKVTHMVSLDPPTTIELKIPAALVYWGAPVPPHVAAECIIPLEHLRRRAEDYVE